MAIATNPYVEIATTPDGTVVPWLRRQCLACYSHFGWWISKGSSGVCGSTINKSTIPGSITHSSRTQTRQERKEMTAVKYGSIGWEVHLLRVC